MKGMVDSGGGGLHQPLGTSEAYAVANRTQQRKRPEAVWVEVEGSHQPFLFFALRRGLLSCPGWPGTGDPPASAFCGAGIAGMCLASV